ncbi:MAG TPA: hypothetical protein PKV95_04255, partial [Anaerolineaceae bacterium]|nr:hypothetical protein [Anaerolineaceae bacterium]
MKQASFSLRTVLIIVALLVLLPTAVVLAQEIITSAEPGYVNPPDAFASQIIGDDPDEDGYTGPVVSSPGVAVPSEGESDLETLPAEPASEGEFRPDELQPEAPEAEPQWSGFYYDFSAGATMRPRASLTIRPARRVSAS